MAKFASKAMIEFVKCKAQINLQAELEYIKFFIEQSKGNFDTILLREQLRALWTAYCFHKDMDVDTANYDAEICGLWGLVSEEWTDFSDFDNYMCGLLV